MYVYVDIFFLLYAFECLYPFFRGFNFSLTARKFLSYVKFFLPLFMYLLIFIRMVIEENTATISGFQWRKGKF